MFKKLNDNTIDFEEMLEGLFADSAYNPFNLQLPDPGVVQYYQFFQQRKIWLHGGINENVIDVTRAIQIWNMEDKDKPVEERKPIWLYLYGYGGALDYAWELIDIISLSKTPVYTVNFGQCASANGLVFMAGKKRFMLPNATVVIHEGSAQFAGDAQKVLDNMDVYKVDLKKMKDFILSKTRIDSKLLNRKRSNDWTIDSKFCLENGVCDVIVESLDEVI